MPGQAHRIFISYRRNDHIVLAYSTTLLEQLELTFPGQVFRDQQDLPLGLPFSENLKAALESCEAMLVCINDPKKWQQGSASTIFDEKDWVRREIERGLERGIAVVPVIFLPGGRRPSAEEIPESLHPLLSRQEVKIDVSQADWATYQIPALVNRLRDEMPVPSDRHILSDQLFALIHALEFRAGRQLSGMELVKLYLMSAGLERVPDTIRFRPKTLTLAEVLRYLKGLQGDQLFEFARRCRTFYQLDNQPETPLAKWLQDHGALLPVSDAEPEPRLRLQFVLHPKSHWSVSSEALQIQGTLRLGPHALRITSEVILEAVCIPGKNMELVLEPLITGLVDWLHRELGKQVASHLAPRIEFFARRQDARLGDPLNWPLERIQVGERRFGELFAICRRIYERHLNCSDDDKEEWRRRSQDLDKDPFVKGSFLHAADWEAVGKNFINRKRAFIVVDGSSGVPSDLIVERAYTLGFWSRTSCPEWNETTVDQVFSDTDKLVSLPDCIRNCRFGPSDSPLHDVIVLFDPCEDIRPYDPRQEPDRRNATRSASLL